MTFFAASRNEVESECEHAESASESCTRTTTNSKEHDNHNSNENDYNNNCSYNAGSTYWSRNSNHSDIMNRTSKSDESN